MSTSRLANILRNAKDPDTKQPYVAVTYELSGSWLILGSLAEYGDNPNELGKVLQELLAESDVQWPDLPEEQENLLVQLRYLTDRQVQHLPEFGGW